jgi:hypothetical protein
MNDAEDGCIGSDSESHDEDGNTGETGTFAEQPDSEFDVLYEECHVRVSVAGKKMGNLVATLEDRKDRIIKAPSTRQGRGCSLARTDVHYRTLRGC